MTSEQRAAYQQQSYSEVTILKTWTNIHLEMLQKYKSLKYNAGIKYIAGIDEYSKILSSFLKFYV
jgi:hypothetical protein